MNLSTGEETPAYKVLFIAKFKQPKLAEVR